MEAIVNGIKGWLGSLGNFTLDRVVPALVLLIAGIIVIRIIMFLVKKTLERSSMEKAAHTLIKSALRIVLYLLLGLIVASAVGIDVTGIVALASVQTLAVSLALQNVLTNVFGGFTLLYTNPFASGDFVEIAGQSGTVQEIGLTYTKLVTSDQKLVSIPNSSVTAAQIVNYSGTGKRRVTVRVSASYDSKVETVLEALREAANVPTAFFEPEPVAALESYGDSAINYLVHIWCDAADYYNTLFEVNKKIKVIFDEKGIEMTYPHLNVHIEK